MTKTFLIYKRHWSENNSNGGLRKTQSWELVMSLSSCRWSQFVRSARQTNMHTGSMCELVLSVYEASVSSSLCHFVNLTQPCWAIWSVLNITNNFGPRQQLTITSPVSFWSQQLILACQSANIKGAAAVWTLHYIAAALITTIKLTNAQLWLPFLYTHLTWNALWRTCCLIHKYCLAVVFRGLHRAKKLTVRRWEGSRVNRHPQKAEIVYSQLARIYWFY